MMDEETMTGEQPAAQTTSVDEDHRLSVVSQMYDRGNKGYLDETEQKLRMMDSMNQGYLDVNKVYELMQTMEREQRKSLNLKRAVIALSCFAVLLALANIGTSFAAAKLAKDTVVDPTTGALMVKGTANMVGTNDRVPVVSVMGPSSRRLQTSIDAEAGRLPTDFPMSPESVDAIMLSICDAWPGMSNYDGPDTFTCGNSGSAIVEHCAAGIQTTLKYKEKPDKFIDHVVLRFLAYQQGYAMRDVEIFCPLEPGSDCFARGLSCDVLCKACTTGGLVQTWMCPEGKRCGCFPNDDYSCVAVDAELSCESGCYPGTLGI